MKLLAILGGFACVLVPGARAQWYPASNNVTVVYPPPETPPQVVMVRTHRVPATADIETATQQTTYLIAFKNSVVRIADQYWVSGNTLNYVTADHQQMTAPLNTVDRTLSERLNSEQNVAFSLPAEQAKAKVQAHLAHHLTNSTHNRCCCVSGPTSAASGTASRASSAARAGK